MSNFVKKSFSRLNMDEDLLTVDMLPAPRKVIPKTEEVKLEPVQIPRQLLLRLYCYDYDHFDCDDDYYED